MRRAAALVLILCGGCGPADPPAPVSAAPRTNPNSPGPGSTPERLKRAESLMKEERLAEAGAAFREILAQDPRHIEALAGLGRIASRMGDAASALQFLTRANELQPDDPALLNHLGAVLVMNGRRTEAAKAFARSQELRPGDPQVAVNAALNLADLNQWGPAREQARRAAELLPRDPTPWLVLGRLEARQGRHAEALPHFQEAARRGPEEAIVQYHLGKALIAAGRKQDALAPLRSVLHGRITPEIRREVELLIADLEKKP